MLQLRTDWPFVFFVSGSVYCNICICNQIGHVSKGCTTEMRCCTCKETGHMAIDCQFSWYRQSQHRDHSANDTGNDQPARDADNAGTNQDTAWTIQRLLTKMVMLVPANLLLQTNRHLLTLLPHLLSAWLILKVVFVILCRYTFLLIPVHLRKRRPTLVLTMLPLCLLTYLLLTSLLRMTMKWAIPQIFLRAWLW